MAILSPYQEPRYPLSTIQTGLYTKGGEFVHYLDPSMDYVGLYHRLPSGELWSEDIPVRGKSVRLTPKRMDATEDVKRYNKIKQRPSTNYVSPVPHFPIIDEIDYERGYVYRYFVQKRTNPRSTIVEIDMEQQSQVNSNNRPGINLTIWNNVAIQWSLSPTFAMELNRNRLAEAEKKFEGITNFLPNLLEFVK